MTNEQLDQLAINTIRTLSIDAVQQAKSGHPGLVTLRPGDANEVVEAYRYIMQLRHGPAVLALSRQACRLWIEASMRRRPASRVVPTCLQTLPAGILR